MPKTFLNSACSNRSDETSALVFDWGLQHIGVALVTPTTHIAVPLKTLTASKGHAESKDLDELFQEHEPAKLVVGLPVNMDGAESTETRKARRFGDHLQRRYRKTVEYVDERLTTKEAGYRIGSSAPDHSLAALVIAESWLNRET